MGQVGYGARAIPLGRERAASHGPGSPVARSGSGGHGWPDVSASRENSTVHLLGNGGREMAHVLSRAEGTFTRRGWRPVRFPCPSPGAGESGGRCNENHGRHAGSK